MFKKYRVCMLNKRFEHYGRLVKEYMEKERVCLDTKDYEGFKRWCKKCNKYLHKRTKILFKITSIRG